MPLPALEATRYVTPLREGGSLPAVVEAEDASLWVAKFRGAGQGAPVLVSELICGALAHALGLPAPELALLTLHEGFGRTERDPEIQDILKASVGCNVGLRFLEGALNFDPLADADLVGPELAADVVWLDALVTNIDRTPRNPNLLVCAERLWLIDHGAALYFHHNWPGLTDARVEGPFAPIAEHVLLPFAGSLEAASARLAPRVGPDVVRAVLDAVPDALLVDAPPGRTPAFSDPGAARDAYADVLDRRVAAAAVWAGAAEAARRRVAAAPRAMLDYRR